MSDATDTHDEADVLSFDLCDEAIERAADGKAAAANPTVVSAIICIPL